MDLGLGDSEHHTAISRSPAKAALSAFLDFFYMMDSTVLIRGGSSFSSAVANIRGMRCSDIPDLGDELTKAGKLNACTIGCSF